MNRYKVGDLILVDTFACVKVRGRVVSKSKDGEPGHPCCFYTLTHKMDTGLLMKAGVPSGDDWDTFKSIAYNDQIVKVLERASKQLKSASKKNVKQPGDGDRPGRQRGRRRKVRNVEGSRKPVDDDGKSGNTSSKDGKSPRGKQA
jgi:hypothetical protein